MVVVVAVVVGVVVAVVVEVAVVMVVVEAVVLRSARESNENLSSDSSMVAMSESRVTCLGEIDRSCETRSEDLAWWFVAAEEESRKRFSRCAARYGSTSPAPEGVDTMSRRKRERDRQMVIVICVCARVARGQ